MVDLTRQLRRVWKYLDIKQATGLPQGPQGANPPALLPGGNSWPVMTSSGTAGAALRSSAVWACCNIISKSIATLPTGVFRETPTGCEPAKNHPYSTLLTTMPNPSMTLQQWLQPTMLHLLLWGNAFTYIDRIGGEVVGLWPLLPDRMRIQFVSDSQVLYTYFDRRGRGQVFQPGQDIIHFRLFSLDGYIGLSVLQFQALTIDFQDMSSAFAYNLYANGGRPNGVLSYPNTLKKDQVDKIRESWANIHGGVQGAGKVAILEGGAKYESVAIPPEGLQFIETQKWSVEQIARVFGVAPHLIGAMDKPTYASVEQQSIEFLRYTISPYVKALESSIDSALLEAPYYYKFNLNAFERSDIRTRYLAYATGRQWGWLSVNDIRRLEDLNGIGSDGDIYLQPLNMVPAGTESDPPSLAGTGPTPGGNTEVQI